MPFEGAYVTQSKTLSWICNNTKKMKLPLLSTTAGPAFDATISIPSEASIQKQAPLPGKFSYAAAASKLSPGTQPPSAAPAVTALKGTKNTDSKKSSEDSEVECWTLTSTREFGASNKVESVHFSPLS